jgi:hypothetical protein
MLSCALLDPTYAVAASLSLAVTPPASKAANIMSEGYAPDASARNMMVTKYNPVTGIGPVAGVEVVYVA